MSPVEILKSTIAEKEEELLILQEALAVLTSGERKGFKFSTPEAQSEPTPSPLKAVTEEKTSVPAPSIPATPVRPVYTGPRCGACGAKMYQTYRTMPSGAVVNLLKCNDSACGNEAYQ